MGDEEDKELQPPVPPAETVAEAVSEPAPEPVAEVTPEPPEEIAAIKADLERERQQRQKLEKRLSDIGREKARLESLVTSGRASPVDEKRIDSLEEMLAELLDRNPSEEDMARSRSYKRELQERRQAKGAVEKTRSEAYAQGIWRPIDRALTRAGVPMEKVTQNPDFLRLWQAGKLEEAQDFAFDLIANPGKKATPEPSAEEETEAETEARKKQEEQAKKRTELRASGALKNERGGGGPASLTVKEILSKPIPANLTPQQAEEYKKLLLAQMGVKG